MTVSGTYSFSPTIADIIDEAFERAGVDEDKLTARHTISARRSINFMFSDWTTKGVHQWTIDQQSQTLATGISNYTLPTGSIDVLSMVLRRNNVDIAMFPMSHSDYLSIPNKTQEGMPNRYFVDRQQALPIVYLWLTPENNTDEIIYYRLRRIQDAGNMISTPDIPPHWFEAMASGLAARLAVKYNPARLNILKEDAFMAFNDARQEDRERSPTVLRVSFSRSRR